MVAGVPLRRDGDTTFGGSRVTPVHVSARSRTVSTLIGIFVGILVVGLALPYVIGEDTATVTATGNRSVGGSDLPEGGTPPAGVDDLAATDVGSGPGAPDDALAGSSGAVGAAPTTVAPRDDAGGLSASDARPSSEGGAPSSGPLTATDVGVTADSIRIGVLLLDLGGASAVGFGAPGLPSPEGQRRIWEGHIAEWNEAGGINGRRIVPVFRAFDPLSASSRKAACLALTEDAKTFAVFDPTSGYNGGDILCFTEQHRTTFISSGVFNNTSDEVHRRSGNRLFGLSMRGPRILRNATLVWNQLGLLKGKTIGVLDWNVLGNPQTVDKGLVATLEELGYEVTKRVILPERYEDGAAQIPVAVQQMRSAGVDLIVHVTAGLYMAQFSQAAESQGYAPRYVTSDWALNGSDFTNQNNAASFDGTPLVTTFRGNDLAHIPINAAERRCDEIYRRRIGPPPAREEESSAWNVSQMICGVLDVFGRGARSVGPDLTRDRFAGGVHAIGELEVPLYLPGAFRPGKFDLADHYYVQHWKAGCKCYRVVSGPHRAPVT